MGVFCASVVAHFCIRDYRWAWQRLPYFAFRLSKKPRTSRVSSLDRCGGWHLSIRFRNRLCTNLTPSKKESLKSYADVTLFAKLATAKPLFDRWQNERQTKSRPSYRRLRLSTEQCNGTLLRRSYCHRQHEQRHRTQDP